MAVYQISKIQIRRGKSRTGPGFPQLASGEMGWAIDSQELYIGNGSVSEGAPSVGNTKILTSNDLFSGGSGGSGLLSLLTHTFKSEDNTYSTVPPNSNLPIVRSLQTILDDNAYVTSFGAVGDGITDDTLAIQRAINQIFANNNLKAFLATSDAVSRRMKLNIPAGIYKITDTLVIPSYATIVGAGIDKTIIRYTEKSTIAVRLTPDDHSSLTPDDQLLYNVTRPRYIHLEGITIEAVELGTVGLDITNALDSSFTDIKILGQWVHTELPANKGMNVVTTENVQFNNIIINKFYYGIYVGNAVSNVTITNGSITHSKIGIAAGINLLDTQPGVSNLSISKINFTDITTNGLLTDIGLYNSITDCSFIDVGGDNVDPTYPQLYFTRPNIVCTNIKSDRSAVLSGPSSLLPRYVPEVSGSGSYTSETMVADVVVTSSSSSSFLRLPLRTDADGTIIGAMSYTIDYVFDGLFSRKGTISISANAPSIVSSEEYTCDTTSNNGILLDFTVSIEDNSINVAYTNTLSNNTGTLTYSYISKF